MVVEFLLQPEIFSALITLSVLIVIGLIAWRGRRWLNHFRLVFQVWHFVEKTSMLTGWKGYGKLAFAMSQFRERFYDAFGREPDPSDEGWAVKILTWLCEIEDKESIEDFPDPSTENSDLESLAEGA